MLSHFWMQSIQDRKELTDISEEVTKRLAIKRKPQGLGENIEVAKKGSNVAKNTRDDIEELLGGNNYYKQK